MVDIVNNLNLALWFALEHGSATKKGFDVSSVSRDFWNDV
jgi:hypothetical protein